MAGTKKFTEQAPYRAESLHGASKYCRDQKLWNQAYMYSGVGVTISLPKDSLFSESWVYSYAMLDEYALSCFYTGRFKDSMKAGEALLKRNLPEEEKNRIKKNLEFARKRYVK